MWVRRRVYLIACNKARPQVKRWSDRMVREATSEDIDLLSDLSPKPKIFSARFDRGDRAFVVEKDGRILAMAWVCLYQRRE